MVEVTEMNIHAARSDVKVKPQKRFRVIKTTATVDCCIELVCAAEGAETNRTVTIALSALSEIGRKLQLLKALLASAVELIGVIAREIGDSRRSPSSSELFMDNSTFSSEIDDCAARSSRSSITVLLRRPEGCSSPFAEC
jgi:hypothetical protein